MHELSSAWCVNHQLTLDLLTAIPAKAMGDKYSERTRTVAAQFAHVHFVRVNHIERRGPDLLGKLKTFPRGAQPTKKALKAALTASAKAVTQLVERFATNEEVRQWGGNSPASYLGYLVAHEAHHRALVIVSLRLGGHKLTQDLTTGMWYAWRRNSPKPKSAPRKRGA